MSMFEIIIVIFAAMGFIVALITLIILLIDKCSKRK